MSNVIIRNYILYYNLYFYLLDGSSQINLNKSSMYHLRNYSKYCPKRVTLKINMCLSRAAHHKLSLRHGYCFGKQLRSITTIPVCINFRLYYVSKNAESQFSIMQLLNIFFQSFRNVNVCTCNNIFLIFCGIFLFLFFISYAH